jgi:hypothetical protein
MAQLRRNLKYPVQIVLMVSAEVGELIERLATEQDLHKTEVSRAFLHAGIRKAGYDDVLFVDKREVPLGELAPEEAEVDA